MVRRFSAGDVCLSPGLVTHQCAGLHARQQWCCSTCPKPCKAARERLTTTTATGSLSLQGFGSFLWDLYSTGMWFFPLVSCLYSFFYVLCSCFAFIDRSIILKLKKGAISLPRDREQDCEWRLLFPVCLGSPRAHQPWH